MNLCLTGPYCPFDQVYVLGGAYKPLQGFCTLLQTLESIPIMEQRNLYK